MSSLPIINPTQQQQQQWQNALSIRKQNLQNVIQETTTEIQKLHDEYLRLAQIRKNIALQVKNVDVEIAECDRLLKSQASSSLLQHHRPELNDNNNNNEDELDDDNYNDEDDEEDDEYDDNDELPLPPAITTTTIKNSQPERLRPPPMIHHHQQQQPYHQQQFPGKPIPTNTSRKSLYLTHGFSHHNNTNNEQDNHDDDDENEQDHDEEDEEAEESPWEMSPRAFKIRDLPIGGRSFSGLIMSSMEGINSNSMRGGTGTRSSRASTEGSLDDIQEEQHTVLLGSLRESNEEEIYQAMRKSS
jgi:hypothetical protein